MGRVRVLRENGGDTVSLLNGRPNGIIGRYTSDDAAHPTKKHGRTWSVPSPDVRRGPEVMCFRSGLRLIVGCERVNPNIKAQIGQLIGSGHGGEATSIGDMWRLLTEVGGRGDIRWTQRE